MLKVNLSDKNNLRSVVLRNFPLAPSLQLIWTSRLTTFEGDRFDEKLLKHKTNLFLFALQSKLNCEVLYDELAFEVRWAVAGESVVIQLVAKLGER